MKSINPGSHRQKIILYYTLAVVLPGIILGYLAYRGIRNDQALREKESRKSLEMISQAYFTAIDSGIVKFMNEHITGCMLSGSDKSDPAILALFIKEKSGSKKIIIHQLLYLPAEFISVQPRQLNALVNLKEGSRLEFIEHKYPEALRFYQGEASNTTSVAEKIQALVASARLNNKMNRTREAKALYEELRKDYPKSLFNEQIPVGLLAGLEILKINRARGEKDELRKNLLQCLELLLHPACEYDENQFDLFFQSVKDIITETDHVIDSLFNELNTQRTRNDHISRIISMPDLLATGSNNFFKYASNGISCIPINSRELTAMYLAKDKTDGVKTGMVIDFPAYIKSISGKLIQKLDPDSSINIKIEDNNGRLICYRVIKEEAGYLSFPFPENFPNWKLVLSENKPGFTATLLKAGSGLYLFIFILIALLMVLGFVFIMYTLNVEFRLNKLKSEFISNVSHELKSPLTSIRMMTEMLFYKRVLTEERKSVYYSAMLEESEHLSHLIDNILDFSGMEDDRKKYDFAGLDLNELLLRFLDSTRERLTEPAFNIRYSCPDSVPVVSADRNAILQVFYNLIDNAIKFSGTSRQIDISLFSRDDELLFCVKDYGIGISGKDQEKIFERFYRGSEPQRMGIKGSGIGLTIVKKIVEIHKGSLTLDSKPGEGSTFCVHLPLHKNIET